MGYSDSMFQTPVDSFIPNFEGLKTWFKLSRGKLYRNDLRLGNKNYCELAGGSSFQGFELLMVKKKTSAKIPKVPPGYLANIN